MFKLYGTSRVCKGSRLSAVSICFLFALSLYAGGCARTRQSKAMQSGFLGDYSGLRKGGD